MARLKGSKTWTLEEKAEAVAILDTDAKGCFIEAERLTDMSRVTIAQAAKDPQITQIAEVKKQELGKRFNSLLSKLLARYEEQVSDADLSNKGTTLLGIVADKALLYNDQPNQISANVSDNEAKYLQFLIEKGYTQEKAQEIVSQAAKLSSEFVM